MSKNVDFNKNKVYILTDLEKNSIIIIVMVNDHKNNASLNSNKITI